MNANRVACIAAVAVFAAAFFAPACQVIEAGAVLNRTVDQIPGFRLALLGWLGPLEACFAWFANPPLAVCVVRLARGRPPGRTMTLVGTVLALSVLFPQVIFQTADGWHIGYFRGAAVWLWLSSFGVVLMAASLPAIRKAV